LSREIPAGTIIGDPKWWAENIAKVAHQAIAELESQEPVATVTSETGADITMSWWHEPALPMGTKLFTHPPQRTWVDLTEEELRIAFGKLYPNDIGLLELAENNKDYAVEAIGARHHWTAFKAGARAGEAKLKDNNT